MGIEVRQRGSVYLNKRETLEAARSLISLSLDAEETLSSTVVVQRPTIVMARISFWCRSPEDLINRRYASPISEALRLGGAQTRRYGGENSSWARIRAVSNIFRLGRTEFQRKRGAKSSAVQAKWVSTRPAEGARNEPVLDRPLETILG
jgi:hypothetical protein